MNFKNEQTHYNMQRQKIGNSLWRLSLAGEGLLGKSAFHTMFMHHIYLFHLKFALLNDAESFFFIYS